MTWECDGIHVVYSGHTSSEEVARFARQGQADERFTELRYVLHDFTCCEGATYSDDVLHELAAIDSAASETNSRIRVAVVTERDDVRAMVDAYLSANFSGFELQVFASLASASAWLGRSLA